MDQFKRDLYVARINSGSIRLKLDNKTFIYRKPNKDFLYEVEEYLETIYQEALSMELMPQTEHFLWLIENKLWSKKEEEKYKKTQEDLEYLKTRLFNVYYKSSERKAVKGVISKTKKELSELHKKRHDRDDLSIDYFVKCQRMKILIALGTGICPSLDSCINYSDTILDSLFFAYYKNKIEESDFRNLARNDPWKSYWSCKDHGNLFGIPICDFTEEQRQLCMCSIMYDNIAEHSESPSGDILEDDDALDGWMIIQRNKAKSEKNQKTIDFITDNEKIRNSQEIFIVSDGSKEDIERINALNDPGGLAAKKVKFDYLASQGIVDDHRMPGTKKIKRGE